jgi:hypothetical protein
MKNSFSKFKVSRILLLSILSMSTMPALANPARPPSPPPEVLQELQDCATSAGIKFTLPQPGGPLTSEEKQQLDAHHDEIANCMAAKNFPPLPQNRDSNDSAEAN